jgi:RND superfamily putative drug exporter
LGVRIKKFVANARKIGLARMAGRQLHGRLGEAPKGFDLRQGLLARIGVATVLSTAAAYGVLVLVFQDGWLASQLGITPSGVIESWVPLFIFTILFGLSMDYHLFILTRIKEARDRGLESRAAVAKGISVTSGTITSAASIMVVVFAVFVTLKFVFIQELGLGLAVAVFIDATIIRSVLLPASMTLLGDWNWWMPRFLDWIPRVTIEGDPDEPMDVAPA